MIGVAEYLRFMGAMAYCPTCRTQAKTVCKRAFMSVRCPEHNTLIQVLDGNWDAVQMVSITKKVVSGRSVFDQTHVRW